MACSLEAEIGSAYSEFKGPFKLETHFAALDVGFLDIQLSVLLDLWLPTLE